jgi:hypothetical protein
MVFASALEKFAGFHLHLQPQVRVVAQPGSALAWGARGRWFESSPPDKRERNWSINLQLSFSFFIPGNASRLRRESRWFPS